MQPGATYTRGEEIANSLTHGLGLLLSIAGLAVLVTFAALRSDAWAVTAGAIFGVSLVTLYASSTLYHSLRDPRLKHVVRVIDHVAIFLLIAGTYTPFALLVLHGTLASAILVVVWIGAIAGAIVEMIWIDHPKWVAALIYLSLGWVAVIAQRRLPDALHPMGGTDGPWPRPRALIQSRRGTTRAAWKSATAGGPGSGPGAGAGE